MVNNQSIQHVETLVSIIVVSFNTVVHTKRCIDHIYNANLPFAYEIIVVDNASDDGTVELIESTYPRIFLLKNSANLMYAKANNQGIAVSQGKYLLLLNSDAFVYPETINSLVEFMVNHRASAAVGPKVLNIDGSLQSKGHPRQSIASTILSVTGLLKPFRSPQLLRKYLPYYYWNENETRKVGWIDGCCMLLKRSVVEEIGGLNEASHFYGEEPEWCFRAWKAGYEVWYNPKSSIAHIGRASTTESVRSTYLTNESKLSGYAHLVELTIGYPKGIIITLIVVLANFAKLCISWISKNNRPLSKVFWSQTKWECRVALFLIRRSFVHHHVLPIN
jgi:GT2 family glycosyltransferase